MIDEISNKITKMVKNYDSSISDEKAEVVNYGVNILIYQVFITLLIFLISAFFGLFKYILIALLATIFLRVTAGGPHARGRIGCALMDFSTLFGSVLLSKYLLPHTYIPGAALFIISMAILIVYAPGDTAERPIISEKQRRKQKWTSIAIMVALFILALISRLYDGIIYNIILISAFLAVILLTPPGYRLFKCKRSCEVTEAL